MHQIAFIFMFLLFSLTACTTSPKSDKTVLSNQSPLRVSTDKTLPRQYLSIVFEGLPESVSEENQAIFSLMSTLLAKGPKDMSEEEYRHFLFLKNADIYYSSRYRAFTLSLVAPPQFLPEVLDLALRTIQDPKLDKASIADALQSLEANVRSSFSRMSTVILYYAFKEYFNFAAFTHNGSSSPERVSQLNIEKVKALHQRHFQLKHLRYYASGPMTIGEIKSLILEQDVLKTINYSAFDFADYGAGKSQKRVVIIHRPNVTDHQVLLVAPLQIQRDQPKAAAADALFEIFGGGLTGRLGRVLREAKGLTYQVSANYGSNLPVWYIYSFAGSQQIKDLLNGIRALKADIANANITQKELSLAQRSLITGFRKANELPSDRLVSEMQFDLYDLDTNFLNNYENHVRNIKLTDLNHLAQEIFSQADYTLYLMGDKRVLLPVVKSLKVFTEKDLKIVSEREI